MCNYSSAGVYVAKVTVWHNSGTATATTSINVSSVSNPPPSNPPTTQPQNHLECNSSNQCVSVSGPGPNRCSTNQSCGGGDFTSKCENQNGILYCVNKQCNPNVPGDCNNECKSDSDCGTSGSTHLECYNNACVIVSGPGPNRCAKVGRGCQGNIQEIIPRLNPPSINQFLKESASIFLIKIDFNK